MHNKDREMNKWLDKWSTQSHIDSKKVVFEKIDKFINFQPKRILDIGCGLAYESQMFQKKYNCELYLLDGDFDDTSHVKRDIKYGTVDNFAFYNKVDELKESFDKRKMDYTFVNANNIQIPETIKFDLIISIVSCGFHYPANTYKDLVQKHSTNDTVVIFDLRNHTDHNDVEVIESIDITKKYAKSSIRFV